MNVFRGGHTNPGRMPDGCKACRTSDSMGPNDLVEGVWQRKCSKCGFIQYTTPSPNLKGLKNELPDTK